MLGLANLVSEVWLESSRLTVLGDFNIHARVREAKLAQDFLDTVQ